MNSEAVALAADSAVSMTTETGPKIYQSANKIFALSRSAPVGLMVYDSAKFLGVPWETVAKTYREKRGPQAFATLKEHADDFLKFLRGSRLLFSAEAREASGVQTIYLLFDAMRDDIDRQVEARLEATGTVSEADIKAIVGDLIEQLARLFQARRRLAGTPTVKTLAGSLRPLIKYARDRAFEKLPLSPTDKRRLTAIAVAAFNKDGPLPIRTPSRSGVVIAGFGTDEIFPRVYDVVIEGLFKNTLKIVQPDLTSIEPMTAEAVIIPFAQREIVDAFLGGIEPDFRKSIRAYWSGVFTTLGDELIKEAKATGKAADRLRMAVNQRCQDLLDGYDKEVRDRRQKEYVSPILDAVAMLPKDELGAMAEALVNLTSFRRKVSVEAETVGGPIDVAVISKGDGLIWIKRKHYFESGLNPQYFASRFGGKL